MNTTATAGLARPPTVTAKASPASGSQYRFGEGPLREELPRVVGGRLDHATGLLRGSGDPAHAVHEARKDMKKIRSALRLVRASLGDDVYRRENHHYRDVSRGLARFRDADAMLECLVELEGWDGQPGRFAGLRALLLDERRAGRRDGSMRRAASRAADLLERGSGRIGRWRLPDDAAEAEETLDAGLGRAYGRGRSRLERVEQDASDERLHDWRKRVKDLWYQQLLVNRDPGLAERAHRLSGLLGDDHDLAVLRAEILDRGGVFSWHGEQRRLLDLVVRRRDQLQAQALELGRALYARPPSVRSR